MWFSCGLCGCSSVPCGLAVVCVVVALFHVVIAVVRVVVDLFHVV